MEGRISICSCRNCKASTDFPKASAVAICTASGTNRSRINGARLASGSEVAKILLKASRWSSADFSTIITHAAGRTAVAVEVPQSQAGKPVAEPFPIGDIAFGLSRAGRDDDLVDFDLQFGRPLRLLFRERKDHRVHAHAAFHVGMDSGVDGITDQRQSAANALDDLQPIAAMLVVVELLGRRRTTANYFLGVHEHAFRKAMARRIMPGVYRPTLLPF